MKYEQYVESRVITLEERLGKGKAFDDCLTGLQSEFAATIDTFTVTTVRFRRKAVVEFSSLEAADLAWGWLERQ